MKKYDYFFASLLITLILFFCVCGFLVAEYNSAKYIPTNTPRLIQVENITAYSGEITILGEKKQWDYSYLEEDIMYLKRFLVVIPREIRITADATTIFYQYVKNFFHSVTVGDDTVSPPKSD